MDKNIKIFSIIGIIAVSASLVFSFIIKPISKNFCIEKAEKEKIVQVKDAENGLQKIYDERSALEDEKQALEKAQNEIISSMDKDEDNDFVEKRLAELHKEYQQHCDTATGLSKALCTHRPYLRTESFEKQAIQEYHESNSDYLEITNRLNERRQEIEQYNKLVKGYAVDKKLSQIKENFEEGVRVCSQKY